MSTDEGRVRLSVPMGWWAAFLLVAVVFAASLGSGFVYDDHLLIVQNPYVHDFSHLGRAFTTHFWNVPGDHQGAQHYYRPLVTLSYMVDFALGGGRPWAFHLGNVVLHALAVWLAARWAGRLLGPKLWMLPVLLFAAHPTRAESVFWISGRTDLMVTVFLLLAVEAAHRARGGKAWWAAFVAALTCAFLSKELAVVAPLLLLGEAARRTTGPARLAAAVAGGMSALYLVLRSLLLPLQTSDPSLSGKLGLLTVESFVERLLWPWPQTMFFRTRAAAETANVELVLGGLVVLVSIVALVFAWRRDRCSFWLFLAALATLLPVSNVVPSGLPVLAADRFWYLPLLLGTLAGTRLLGPRLTAPRSVLPWLRVAGVGALIAMCAVLVLRLPPFEDNDSFYNHELALDRCNPLGLEHRAHVAASRGELTVSLGYLEAMLTPPCVEKTRVQPTLLEKARGQRLALTAATTPDGDAVGLGQLLDRLVREGAAARGKNLNLKVEIAGVATRLGRDDLATKHLAKLGTGSLDELAAPANVVLTYARLGQYEQAHRFLERLARHDPAPLIDEATRSHLSERLSRAALLFRKAHETAEPSAELRALAQAELGAYLRALRILSPSRAHHARTAKVLFVQLLVMARLEDHALSVLASETSEGAARKTLATLRASLPTEVVALARVPPTRAPGFLTAE